MSMADEDVWDVCKFFDNHGDKKISINDIGICLRALGHKPTEAQIENFTRKFSDKAKCRLSMEEFIPIINDLAAEEKKMKQFSNDDYVKLFQQMDREGKGMIRYTSLKYLLTKIGDKLSDDELDETLAGLVDKDGMIPYKQYVQRICDLSDLSGQD